ncbi:SpoVA/SpoVAEb family sporulation membrane protein [Heliophilum fasciatum]|uniref:Stage V sporulation protein AE n=1 Tax=Heliophilum fasciatum TaxID=35700 RepID=A0A4R2S7J2_9FIRM|nr:SpoVA/SpoVAEb family sporulation membrane protein [Heliophilum fasciatum]MCW2277369.1 stage V sporulation protein AE [Heliophilum fasciatum]TCP67205.1 stage V sporulation protein AE [Heliophilum fasciatum]
MEQIGMAFLIGGLICLAVQLVIDLTPVTLTAGHVMVGLVTGGAVLSALGWYEPLVQLAGAGATVPLSGFGHALAQGAMRSVDERGLLGALSGGIEATAVGVATAVIFGYTMAVLFDPKPKR